VICSQIEKLLAYHVYVFCSTSPEEFKIRLEEHHKQESVVKRGSGENRKFSWLSDPKEEIAKSPTFTKQKVKTLYKFGCNKHVKYL
jgi:hypothetical protein